MPVTDTALAAIMYAPGSVIPANLKQIAAILYGGNAVVPDHLMKLALLNRGGVLATGQTTQYSSELDDGNYQKGLAKRYAVLTTGQYASTANLDLAHYTGTDIGFTSANPDTITSTVLDFTTMFVAGDVIVISGATNAGNNTNRTIAAAGVAANVLTLTSVSSQTVEAAGASVTIAKREAHSNACVLDNNTGLMWSRTVSDKMGTASDGKMPWTGKLYDIFAYCGVANTSALAGYSDWRVPNRYELATLSDLGAANALPDSTAFPGFPTAFVFSSSTLSGSSNDALVLRCLYGDVTFQTKTNTCYVILVRGG